ncbi:MAG: NADH-dependent [FeFe] hydrogenase, group A6 [Butyrivibrio sp.]|nr:NADH-dependent [FeFe] hydrogenase, group A6 [Muribaculum sp.]MCM1552421.1 NADH-dependent [FeFe] hydrogenase, group A6 [Butyrivibrio sp.]
MVKLTIDGIELEVAEGTTVMKAASSVGIEVPHLCFLEGINEISACKVCVVELQGKSKLITACNSPVEEGMVIYTNSPKVRKTRRTNVELILSQHDCHCATCVRSGNCSLQRISNDLGILEVPFKEEIPAVPWDENFPLIRDSKKCIKCMRCVQICDKVQAMHVWDVQNTGSRTTVDVAGNEPIDCSDCTLCGQCITHCPTGALRERDDVPKVYEALADPEKVTVVQVAPAVRAAWGEALGLGAQEATEGLMVAALKRIGFDYVFDTNYSADLTIMEEGNELLERLGTPDKYAWPMFTSCCPGWVSFVSKKYPAYLRNLSTAKSPQQMFGAMTKSYFAQKKGIDPNNICSISVMPCVSKKREAALPYMKSAGAGADVDIVLTTREFVRMIRAEHINPRSLKEENFDSPLGESTGAGVIFGVTGGVMEAALRTAYAVVAGKNPDPDAFQAVRGEQGRREADFQLGDKVLHTCTVSGLGNAEKLMEDIVAGRVAYDFVEVMACPGGCVGGGGQPIHDGCEMAQERGGKLYQLDKERPLRFSHENKEVQRAYEEYLGKPLSHRAHELLHSEHVNELYYETHNYL